MTSAVGARAPRADGEVKVRGEAIYGVDFSLPGMCWAKLLRSPVAAGRIVLLDTSQAEAMTGVVAIATADHAPHLGGWVMQDQPLFARDYVRYEGEPVAVVAAESLSQAEAAVQAIQLVIEETEPIRDIEAALAPGAPLVHPEWESYVPTSGEDYPRGGNVVTEMVSDPEGVDEAFAKADLVVSDEFRADRQYQAYMEPQNALAIYESGRFIVHVAHQYPFNVRDRVAQFLGVRPADVRVIGHHVGGGFGAKLDVVLEPYAALLARLAHRPVKLVNDRAEDLLTCTSRENAIVRIRTAVARDGTMLGRQLECLLDAGAYAGESPSLASIPLHVAGAVYKVGPVRVHSQAVYTNTASTGAFRGVGGTYLYFALERHMDHIARELGADRREFRLQNLFSDGDQLLNGQTLPDAGILRKGFEEVERVAAWDETGQGPNRGVGVAAAIWLTNPMPGSATVKLNEDGTVGVVTGATDNGSGAVAMGVTQIAAEELGVSPSDVVVLMPDTDAAPYDAGSQGSRTTHIVGRAIREASVEVRERILETAAELMEAAQEDLVLEDGHVRVVGVPDSGVSLEEVATAATFTKGPISGTGSYTTPPPEYNPSCASGLLFPIWPTPTYHVHLAEVEVDPVTGVVTVLRYVVAQEVGKAINPDGVVGQIQGGVTQGIGYALYENIRIEDARYLQRTLEAYRLPVALDIPRVEVVLLEHPDEAGPYGAKGVAEPPVVPVAAALGNAIEDAIGAPVNDVPMTPELVLRAIMQTEV